MLNDRLVTLADYPFQRLRTLLHDVKPPMDRTEIAMHIGEPKHEPPALVGEILAAHLDGWGRYPPPAGTAELLEAIAGWLGRRYRLPDAMIDPSREILPIAGSREALFLAALAAVPRGGASGGIPAVLLPNPYYAAYYGAAVIAGAEPVLLPAVPENGYQPDLGAVDADLLKRTALVYLNSPSNPHGAVADLDQLKRAIETARAHDFVLAVDECYSEIYTGAPPPGALEACAALGGSVDHVAIFNSLSKRSSAPGLRSGFVAGDANIVAAIKVLHQYGGATIPVPIQAVSSALWSDETHVDASRDRYRDKFDVALSILDGRFGARRPKGGFLMWLDVGDGEAAAHTLLSRGAVRVLPGAYLAQTVNGINPGDRFIRVAVVHDTETVRDGMTRIVDILADGQ